MNDARRPPARVDQVVLRLGIVLGALGALATTRAAVDRHLLVLDVIVIGLALVCTTIPDSHTGLLVTAVIVANWLASVDDTTTPWAIGAAASLTVFHVSMAASSVAPLAATWTPAMRRRWMRRLLAVCAMALPTWVLVVGVTRVDLGASPILMTSALVVIAAAASWAGARARSTPRTKFGP